MRPVSGAVVTVSSADVENVCDDVLRQYQKCAKCDARWTKHVGRVALSDRDVFCDAHAPSDAVDGNYAFVVRAANRMLAAARAVNTPPLPAV